jgi:hypothetical protein
MLRGSRGVLATAFLWDAAHPFTCGRRAAYELPAERTVFVRHVASDQLLRA